MNDEELELDLFGNQENEEGDTTLDADISSIMESIGRSIRDTRYVFNRHRPMTMTLDLERAVGYARPIESIPVRMTLDENRIVPMMESAPPSMTRVNARGIRANNVYYDTEATVTRSNEIAEMIRNTMMYPITKTQVSDDYSKVKSAADSCMEFKNDSGCFQIEKIREETMHSSPRKMFGYINSSGHRDTISVSKNFQDAFVGLHIEDNLDRYKEIVEDAINVINILRSTNDRLYMNFNMTNSALSASKESVRDLNNQLATVKMNFDKLMAFTRK